MEHVSCDVVTIDRGRPVMCLWDVETMHLREEYKLEMVELVLVNFRILTYHKMTMPKMSTRRMDQLRLENFHISFSYLPHITNHS